MISTLALSCVFSVATCFCLLRFLVKGGFLDVPTERSSHVIPTPKGGGVGLVMAFSVAAIASGLSATFWLPAIALASVSFLNDLKNISPAPRLVAQFVGASMALLGAWWSGEIAWASYLLVPAILFVVATANWYNFMDGINGMAGITGLVAFASLTLYGGVEQADPLLVPLLAVLGGLAGFLPFNLPRARLFMGDVGSIFLGFLFACCVCLMAKTWTEFFVFASFLFPFYADEVVTMAERIWRGESLHIPHRRHLYQFLANELAVPHWKVSAAYGALQVGMVAAVVGAGRYGVWPVLAIDAVALALWATVHATLKRRHVAGGLGRC